MNQNTVVDYEGMADERATADGHPTTVRDATSYARLVVVIFAVLALFLVIALFLGAVANPAS